MRLAAFLAFFFSGASSLIFQSIWSRMLHKVFGASSVAISTTVAVFMAGLGLGAWFAGKYADRIKHPLITYGVVEGIVGVWALLVPWLVDPEGWLAGVNSYLRNELGAESMGFMLARFACVVPILLVPTTLMGSSLPLLSRHFVQRASDSGQVGSWVGALYSVNTFGACFGVGLGAFLLMPNIGVQMTNGVAAGMNFMLLAMIFGFRRYLLGDSWKPGEKLSFMPTKAEAETKAEDDAEDEADEPDLAELEANDGEPADEEPKKKSGKKKKRKSKAKKKAKAKEPEPEPTKEPDDTGIDYGERPDPDQPAMPIPAMARTMALFAFAASGFASLCYEVVWSRSLAMTIGSSFHAFSLILLTFLVGIGGGSAVASGALAGKRLLGTIAITSGVLTLFANTSWAVESDVGTWAIVSVVFLVPIVGIWGAVTQRRKSMAGPPAGPPIVPALLILVVPAIAALLNLANHGGRLSSIVTAVTLCVVVFLALLVSLRRFPVLQLAMMTLFIASAAFVNYVFQDEVPCAFAQLVSTIERLYDHVGLVQFFMFLTVVLCTLPATLGMGAMFPLVLRVWTRGGDNVGRDVGNVYAGNTLGSILGAWLPGFVLMQSFGMERTIIIGMFVYLAATLILLVAAAADRPKADKGAVDVVPASEEEDEDEQPDKGPPAWYAAAIYVLAPLVPPMVVLLFLLGWKPGFFDTLEEMRWNLSQMTLGVFRVSLADDACSDNWGEPDLVYYHDGLSTTVSVERWGRHYALKNNGKVDASNGDDMPTQIMVAAYPLLMHEGGIEGADVAVVGFGSGVTVGTTLQFPVNSVDVIELERSIPEASKFFAEVNHLEYVHSEFPYVEMDRLTVINDDGRNYLASTDKEYDLIISEPSNPWITGVSDLFTTDHFRITKQRLREGGIYCQWVQLYELSPENIKTIYRTFASQFEHVLVFAAEDLSSDTVLLGSDSPLPLDIEQVRETFQLPGVAQELERAYVHSPYDVFARVLLASRDEVLQFTQIEHRLRGGEWVAHPDSNNDPDIGCPADTCRREPVVLNTDDNAHIEFQAPRDLIGFQRFEGYLANIYAIDWPFGRLRDHVAGFGEGPEAAEAYAEMAMSLIAHNKKAEAASFITRSQDAGGSRNTVIAAEILTRLMTGEGEPALRVEPPVPGPQLAAREARTLMEGFEAVRQAVDIGSYGTALAAMEEIPVPLRLHSGPSLRMLYGYLLFKTASTYQSRYREAIEQFEDLVRSEEDYVERHPEIFYFLGRAHDAELNFDKALRNMRIFVESRLAAMEAAVEEERRRELEGAEGAEGTEGTDGAPTTDEPDAEDPPDAAHKAEHPSD